ncbi:hypothetical protein ACWDOR_19465 [Streptosporangium canum]|uniref:hypothetical protein n=1 Tax=Streptosporangium canum TaxID=324952 RepID=UPI00367EB86B
MRASCTRCEPTTPDPSDPQGSLFPQIRVSFVGFRRAHRSGTHERSRFLGTPWPALYVTLREAGVGEDVLRLVIYDNPLRWLTGGWFD